MRHVMPVLVLSLALAGALGCGGDDEGASLDVSWTFDAGDCESNGVETVRVTWGPEGGATETVDFACADGGGSLGEVDDGTYGFVAEGLDAGGVARAESYGQTVSLHGGGGHIPVEIHLHPAAANVIVSWTMSAGGTCPGGVILPYFVTLYVAPAEPGGELVDDVAEAQESCSTGEVTLEGVPPGDYVVEIDSRAVTPAVRGTAPVTVVAGQDATVTLEL